MGNEKTATFSISGMHCASCSVEIEDELKKLHGISSVNVNYASEQAFVGYDPTMMSEREIGEAIAKLGYKALSAQEQENVYHELGREQELSSLKTKLIISVILSTILLVGMTLVSLPSWFMLLIATPVQFWIGGRFYASAWTAIKRGKANMDTLIALGTSIAYFYSIAVVFFQKKFETAGIQTHLYFDASALIITFIFLGKYLETRAKGRASEAIKKLMNLQPKMALVLREKGGRQSWQSIAVGQVVVGDILMIKPGEQIPVDGIITKGVSTIDQSMVTGESKPVAKKEHDTVIGATVNKTGAFEMKATKVGAQTMLASIIEMVRKAQGSKAPVQNLVDTVSSIFVPIVILLSIISFIIWFIWGPEPRFLHALVSTVSVLVIACPCALGLATPTSIMVGIGRAAHEGFLIKDAQTLQQAQDITSIIFDKTGTITTGKQTVQDLRWAKNLDAILKDGGWEVPPTISTQSFILSIISEIEQKSSHPVSEAVVDYIKRKGESKQSFSVDNFEALSGLGNRSRIDGHTIIIGSQRLLEQEGAVIGANLEQCSLDWSAQAKTVSFVAIDGKAVVAVCVMDALRPGIRQTIKQLKRMGIHLSMITGDNQAAADTVARLIELDEYRANVLPQDKEKVVREYKKAGRIIAMIGDGINDAPALAAADVGIAMGGGTDIALETANIALLRDDISLIPKIIKLSHLTMNNVKQNLVWAFGYNIILIPVAMGLLYPFFNILLSPMLAGASMAFSSVSVVLNALRLKRKKL